MSKILSPCFSLYSSRDGETIYRLTDSSRDGETIYRLTDFTQEMKTLRPQCSGLRSLHNSAATVHHTKEKILIGLLERGESQTHYLLQPLVHLLEVLLVLG